MLQYLADLSPEAGLALANGTLVRTRLQEWLNFITSEIHAGSSPLFNADRPETAREIFRARLFKRFDLIETTLAQHPYLMGSSFTVADAYLFTVLTWMPKLSVDLGGWPNITGYMERIAARSSVIAALAREADVPPVV